MDITLEKEANGVKKIVLEGNVIEMIGNACVSMMPDGTLKIMLHRSLELTKDVNSESDLIGCDQLTFKDNSIKDIISDLQCWIYDIFNDRYDIEHSKVFIEHVFYYPKEKKLYFEVSIDFRDDREVIKIVPFKFEVTDLYNMEGVNFIPSDSIEITPITD